MTAPLFLLRLLVSCEAILGTTAVIVLSLLWWRRVEAARIRKMVRCNDAQILPTPVPVLPRWLGVFGGHTLLINSNQLIKQVEEWAEELGGDYELHVLGRRLVVLTSAEDIRRTLTLRPSKFSRGLNSSRSQWAGRQIGVIPSMFFDEGKEWGRSRRLISPNLVGHNVMAMIPYITKIGERLCTKLEECSDSDEVVDAKDYFARFSHDVIALAAFGIDVDSARATEERPSPSFNAIESTISAMAMLTDVIKLLQWKYLSTVVPWARRVKNNSRQMGIIVQRAIDGARRSGRGDAALASSSSEQEGFAGTLLRKIIRGPDHSTTSNRMKFSDDEVLHQVKGLFIAGTDTTAAALCWTMYYLVKNPSAFARCRAEGLKLAPSRGGMVTTPEQLSQLVFCAAVFREVVRLRTAGPVLIHTCLEEYTTTSGFKIEKGRSVMALTRFASISEENFTRGAEFVPERALVKKPDEDEYHRYTWKHLIRCGGQPNITLQDSRWIESERTEALLGKVIIGGDEEQSVRHVDNAFLGFGSGPRVCPGQEMSRAEAITIIAAICSRFDVSLAPGQPDPPREIRRFTAGPDILKLKFKRREGVRGET